MQRKVLEFSVGLFVLLGFVALLFVSMQAANLGNFSFSTHTYEVSANFDNIGGLKPRAPVKSAGVVVGRVKSISFDQETFQAKVMMDLDDQFKFPADSSANILTSGLLGEQYIGISAGGDDADLKQGSKIEQTQSALVLESLISQFLYQFAEKGGDK
ncbi:MAG: outer membrane lipid asymmetry maintenance protein MlaD [Sutterellaceae bacterium]|nr:outer membrane lipid asymmetry maintenance protein MlaD [Sutterellaceae bacterium]